MRQNNGFERFPEFESKGIEFDVGDKYLFRQLSGLLIHQSCQACSSKPLAKWYTEKCLFFSSWRRSRMIDQVEEMKIWDSTRIYTSGRISGAADKGINNRARQLSTLRPIKLGPIVILVEIRVHVICWYCNLCQTPLDPLDLATYI
jgi:hypothetical protein